MKKAFILLLALLTFLSLCSCNTKAENGESGKTTEGPASVAGTYTWEKDGFGSPFTITLMEDGSYQYYAGILSSYIGIGTWTLEGDTLTMTENEELCGYPNVFHFTVEADRLIYVKQDSNQFMYVTVEDGDSFYLR